MGHKSHTLNSQGRDGNKKGRGVSTGWKERLKKGRVSEIIQVSGTKREMGERGVGRGGSKINGR